MDINEVIAEIAEKNQIIIGKNDPVLVVYTMIKILSEQYKVELDSCLNTFRSSVEEMTFKLEHSISKQSTNKLNAFFEENQDKIRILLNKITDTAQIEINKQIDTSCANLETAFNNVQNSIIDAANMRIKETKFIAYLNLASSLLVMLAVLILVFKFTFS
jgi:Transcriptional activator TraM.